MKPRQRVVAGPSVVARFYARHLKEHKWLFGVVMVGTIGIQAAGLISPLFLRQFFNALSSTHPTSATVHTLAITIGWIALTLLANWIMTRIQSVSLLYLEARVMSDLYLEAFDYLIRHSYHFFTTQFAGTLTRRVSKYAGSFEALFDSFASTFVPTFLYVGGAVAILYTRSHVLGIALGVWAVFFFSFQVFVARLRQPVRAERAEQDSALTGTIADAITNQNTIALFAGERHEHGVMRGSVGRWHRATIRSWLADDYIWSAQGLLMVAINVGLLWGALQYWEKGLLTVGDFVLIQSYLMGIFSSLNNITGNLRRVFDAVADAGEMVYLLQLPHGVRDVPDAPVLTVAHASISFRDADFYFRETRPVLQHFNLEIAAGEKVALVGPSGAGKSTIMKLLLRMYDVSGGSIEIDGQNIARVTQQSLRNSIALVPQEPVLFHRSLLENIRYGRRDASDAEVIEAAKGAHCHEFIENLPERYETFVGERGVRLSGGERQRIAIARAILRDAPVLLLDEATSSLDSESESLIQDSLANLMEGKTVLVIAHRLSTIMKMDRIVVIEDGKVVSQGTHQELLAQGGLYKKLWSIQAGGFITEE